MKAWRAYLAIILGVLSNSLLLVACISIKMTGVRVVITLLSVFFGLLALSFAQDDGQEHSREMLSNIFFWQPKMVKWVNTRLGKDAMNRHERGMRFGEESLELLQAVGIKQEEIIDLMKHVYSKKPGEVTQEIGGVVTTLLVLSESQRVDMSSAALNEIDRIHSLPPEKFQKRQALNAELGIGMKGGSL